MKNIALQTTELSLLFVYYFCNTKIRFMNYRLQSYWNHWKNSKHRGGHGIHSPFLFRLITEVIESKTSHLEYSLLKHFNLKTNLLLKAHSTIQLRESNTEKANKKEIKGLQKIDLPMRYRKLLFRLVSEFKPKAAIYFGSTMGHDLVAMALANMNMPVYQSESHSPFFSWSESTLKELNINSISRITDNSEPPIKPDFILINHPKEPEIAFKRVEEHLKDPGKNDVLILVGIHESKEMNQVWHTLTLNPKVRVTLTLFNLGITFLRDKSQKENFELKF
jgi:hypothetical protein